MIVSDLNNNHSRKKAWQSEPQYNWHLIHTDKDVDTSPAWRIEAVCLWFFANIETNFGKGTNNPSSGGPPLKLSFWNTKLSEILSDRCGSYFHRSEGRFDGDIKLAAVTG